MRALLRQLATTTALVACVWILLGGLSLLGFPTQRVADFGAWLQFRLMEPPHPVPLGEAVEPSAIPSEMQEEAGEPALVLPPRFYTVVGQTLSVFYDNLVLSHGAEAYRFMISFPAKGADYSARRSFSITPTSDGRSQLYLQVGDLSGHQRFSQGTAEVQAAPADAGAGGTVNLLIIGDSVTYQTMWVNRLAHLLSAPGNPRWTMIGKPHKPWAPGVKHEGMQGGSLTFFAMSYPVASSRRGSPFLFKSGLGPPKLDFARYYREKNGGVPADVFIVQAGTNDMWGVDANDTVALNKRVTFALSQADALIAAARAAHPQTAVAIMLPPPLTRSNQTFKLAYGFWSGDRKAPLTVSRWNLRKCQHALVRAMIEHYKDQEGARTWLIPTYACFDTIDGYPTWDAVHPNETGHTQMGDSVYAWLKCWLARPK